jgi:hypothetical protein
METWKIVAWCFVGAVVVFILYLSESGHKQEFWNIFKGYKKPRRRGFRWGKRK